ncbi:HAD family hydrolase [Nocardiopsis trehalosi]|jgi:HAD superfamily hydrolase (TIGR01509 family)|uniref:HAD family hydrolase n=1 Tax=Nocardiopsis trehalosi TaxID=109329 RepID=UPI000835DFD3|nr:HAD family phosphatase [Nocardiopsis trehalosi]
MTGTAPSTVPQAVLFDMDGTLIDSEGLWNTAEEEVVASLGGVWTEQDHRLNIGGSAEQVARYVIELTGTDLPPAGVTALMQDAFARLLADGAETRPGAKELVALVARSAVPSALVTSTERRLVDRAIGAIGIRQFDVTVAGDEVARNKPHPEPYLKAARLLGVDPTRCVAFEDSTVGVASALAAGCVTVAVPDHAEVPPADGLTVLSSLEGVDLAWLADLVAAARG